jgi:cytidine deaminase
MNEALKPSPAPELVFGIVAPIGVDLDLISEVLTQTLREMDYDAHEFRLTSLMREIPTGMSIAPTPYVQSYRDRIAYANDVRRLLGDDALATLAISAIRAFRADEWERRSTQIASDLAEGHVPDGKHAEEAPLPSQAYIIRQFKRPEEVSLLRSVYGRQFILVSAYTPQETRRRRIEERERQSRGGLISELDAHSLAYALVTQDAKEAQDEHGQNVRDAFPLGDVFIDATSRSTCETTIRRFVHLLFGSNEITPTHDEYGMYMAKSASLRSSDLSRQVGAAIFRESGEVATLGCNEVPKAGGGTYWSGDPSDRRDFVAGYDPNEQRKIELLVDLLDRLQKGQHLSADLMSILDPYEIGQNF